MASKKTRTPAIDIGITDLEFIYAEGLNMGDESKNAALAKAHQSLAALTA